MHSKFTFQILFFALCCYTSLDAQVQDFQAEYISGNQSVKLNWIMEQEEDVEKYIVERSIDLENWTIITETEKRNSPQNSTYWCQDVAVPVAEHLYYRLKMVNLDGQKNFSNVINLKIELGEVVDFYPNPVSDVLHVEMNTKGYIEIINMHGVLVHSGPVVEGVNTFDVRDWLGGMYILKLFVENKASWDFRISKIKD